MENYARKLQKIVSYLTQNWAEGRLENFRPSGLLKVQISRIELLDPKWLYQSKRLLQQFFEAHKPSIIVLNIFPSMNHTLGHSRTSFLPFTDDQENREEILNKHGGTN